MCRVFYNPLLHPVATLNLMFFIFSFHIISSSQSYNAKLSDFGFARYGPSSSETHVTTRVAGTLGYLAPEYLTTGMNTTNTSSFL